MKTRTNQIIGISMIAAVGVVHLALVAQEYQEAPYMGILFCANFIAALVAAYGIFRGQSWGWLLGAAVSAGSMLGYVLSRTVGLPGMEIEEWLQPMGVLSLAVEAAYLSLTAAQKPWRRLVKAA